MRTLTFSRFFPKYHTKTGQPTLFIEKIWVSLIRNNLASKQKIAELSREIGIGSYFVDEIKNLMASFDPKGHTIRAGSRWKAGDIFKPVIWGTDINPKSGRSGPYHSKQIQLAPAIEIKKVWDITITTEDDDGEHDWSYITLNGEHYTCYQEEYLDNKIKQLIKNDGLNVDDFYDWFKLERTYKQRVDNESKIFSGQIIAWDENLNY